MYKAANHLGTTDPDVMIRENGLTVLADPESAVVDVVFVHGLQGHPKKTWSFPPPSDERSSNESVSAKLSFGKRVKAFLGKPDTGKGETVNAQSSEPQLSDHCVFWPKDLLPKDFPKARIMTYGYDSHVINWFRGPAMQLDIFSYGESFLNALEAHRRNQPHRPLMFVVHSLGGLVLKDMLRRSRTAIDSDFRSIYTSCHAMLFFGTPHRGGNYVNIGLTARKIATCIGFDANDRVLRDLKMDSSTAKLLREEFAKMLEEIRPIVYTFQEGIGLTGFGPLSGKVVDDVSSALDYSRERKDYIHANHMNMCRFRGASDDGYGKAHAAISRCLSDDASQRNDSSQEILRQRILKSLLIPEASERMEQIEVAYEKTCDFIFENPALGFVQWLQKGTGIYWISGKPGSGKSTLMKFIISNHRTFQHLYEDQRGGKLLWAGFFFSNRGTAEQKSLRGLLCEILHSLLSQTADILNFIQPVYEHHAQVQGVWNEHYLKTALMNIVCQKKAHLKLCLFIDALDEASLDYNSNHERLFALLGDLIHKADRKYVSVRLCLSSRPENIFVDNFKDHPGFPIHEHTADDVETYVYGRMTKYVTTRTDLLSDPRSIQVLTDICEKVVRRASGVFLWVRLIMTDLIEGLIDGDSAETSQRHLSSIPGDGDLQELYHNILMRLKPEYLLEAFCMLHIALAALEPLPLDEFFQAVQFTEEPSLEESWVTSNPAILDRRIYSRCRGFLEIQHATVHAIDESSTKTQIVQFLHQSAKDFLKRKQGLTTIAEKLSLSNRVDGHGFLLEFRVEQHIRRWQHRVDALKAEQSFDLSKFGIFQHARYLETEFTVQELQAGDLLLPLRNLALFIDAHDLAPVYLRHHSWKCPIEWRPDFLAMATMAGLVGFVSQHAKSSSINQYKPLLHWAVYPEPSSLTGEGLKPFIVSSKMVDYLLESEIAHIHHIYEGRTAFVHGFCEHQYNMSTRLRNSYFRSSHQEKAVFRVLLKRGAQPNCQIDVHVLSDKSTDFQPPWSVQCFDVSVAARERQVVVTPLSVTIKQNDRDLVRLLLEYGADYRFLAPSDWTFMVQYDKEMLEVVKEYMLNSDKDWITRYLDDMKFHKVYIGDSEVPEESRYIRNHTRRAWD